MWMGLSIDVDRSGGVHDGRIYVAFADQGDLDGNPDLPDPSDHNDLDIFVMASDDHGATWTALGTSPNAITDTPTTVIPPTSRWFGSTTTAAARSQFFSWLDVDQSTGNVAVSWYDARNDAQNDARRVFRVAQLRCRQHLDGQPGDQRRLLDRASGSMPLSISATTPGWCSSTASPT